MRVVILVDWVLEYGLDEGKEYSLYSPATPHLKVVKGRHVWPRLSNTVKGWCQGLHDTTLAYTGMFQVICNGFDLSRVSC